MVPIHRVIEADVWGLVLLYESKKGSFDRCWALLTDIRALLTDVRARLTDITALLTDISSIFFHCPDASFFLLPRWVFSFIAWMPTVHRRAHERGGVAA